MGPSYKDIMLDIYDTYGKWTLVEGFFDIDVNDCGGFCPIKLNKDSYWVVTGRYSDEMISEAFVDILDSIPAKLADLSNTEYTTTSDILP